MREGRDWWRFTGPMPRDNYTQLLCLFYGPPLFFVLTPVGMGFPQGIPEWVFPAVALTPSLVLPPLAIPAHVRRWRELGRGPGWVALDLIPLVGLAAALYKIRACGVSDTRPQEGRR